MFLCNCFNVSETSVAAKTKLQFFFQCETSPFESNKNKINQTQNPRGGNMAGCPGKGVCPGDVESRLQNYSNTTNILV